MRLATFTHDGQESFGFVKDAGLVDVPALWPGGPRNLLEALAGGHEVLKKIGELTNTIGPQPRAFYAPCGRAETGEQKCTKR